MKDTHVILYDIVLHVFSYTCKTIQYKGLNEWEKLI